MSSAVAQVVSHFQFQGEYLRAHPYGFGHINDTYAAYFRQADGATRRYLLQRINHNVFKNPPQLMQNIQRVTSHLRKKIAAAGGDPDRETLTLIPTTNSQSYLLTDEGNYWRAYIFIEGAKTYEEVVHLAHYYNASKAFGRFQQLLADFPAEQLYETIPDFHHTAQRLQAFTAALEKDAKNRAQSVRPEISFVQQRAEETAVLINLLEQGKLPQRVAHNDTKFNNVMIDDQTGEGVCVIDLDTVMPGLALYDFGDSVRSGTNPAAEDERDLSKVWTDLTIFDRFAHGYLEIARDFLTATEIEYLPFSAKLMTLECGMRFLTDYLSGDVYNKIHRENHNLDRCRTQFKMVQDMEDKLEQMVQIVERYR